MFSGVALSQLITIVGSLVLARLYSPEHFGQLSLFVSIVSILAILATIRYENTIIVIKQDSLIPYITSFLYSSAFLFMMLISFVLFLMINDILNYIKIEEFYFFIPITVFIYALFQISTNLNVREKSFNIISKSKVLMAFIALITQIFFYFLGFDLGLLYGYVLGYFSTLFILYSNISNPFAFKIEKTKTLFFLKKYSYFVKHALPADFINNLATNITPILIAMWFDMKVAGLYFLGYRIINLPLQLISSSIGKVKGSV
jgi:O-antigen/teichoic acid export membrane protein